MALILKVLQASSVLTRTNGYLRGIVSHSLNPYVGCGLGRSLCGVGCYVRHNPWITKGRAWGTFVEAKTNAAALYLAECEKERRWARKEAGGFSIFLASSTEPFQPAERKFGVTRALLEAMAQCPPDTLIVQTHSHRVLDALDALCRLKDVCDLRVHISIETDLPRLPGLPPHASPVEKRILAGRALRDKGVRTVATLAQLLPIGDPPSFLGRLAQTFDAIVIDHFVGGDGSRLGARTLRTALPGAMAQVDPQSVSLAYRDRIVALARTYFREVGVGCDGFAGRYLPPVIGSPARATIRRTAERRSDVS